MAVPVFYTGAHYGKIEVNEEARRKKGVCYENDHRPGKPGQDIRKNTP